MANPQGTPVWYELMTPDPDGAKAFYDDVVGWNIEAQASGDMDYRMVTAPDGHNVAGVLRLTPEMLAGGAKPGWYFYLGVQDVDAMVERIRQAGGSIHMGPMDIPDVGRFALVADPQGMVFYIMRGDSAEESQAFQVNTPGHPAWNELVSSDHKAALDFYGPLFGWENAETMAMGEMGDYAFIDHHGTRIGAAMTAGGGWPTRWTYYVNVVSIDAAKARVEAAGGTVTQGPHEVPGGMHIIQGVDPQGVPFALVGGK